MAGVPKIEDCERVLIVEGYSDLHFYAEFTEHLGKYRSLFIKQFNGKGDMIAKLEVFINPQLLAEKRMIGVMVDADNNPAGTFTSFRSTLFKLTGQTISAPGGWTDGAPRIGLFIAPDPESEGEIETLVWRAWAADSSNVQMKACVDSFAGCMKAAGREAKSVHKGLVSALLAICADEDPRLGPGARNKVFDFSRPEYQGLRDFLSHL